MLDDFRSLHFLCRSRLRHAAPLVIQTNGGHSTLKEPGNDRGGDKRSVGPWPLKRQEERALDGQADVGGSSTKALRERNRRRVVAMVTCHLPVSCPLVR